MSLVSRSWHWLPNSTAPTYDGHYPAGDRPAGGPVLQWAASGYPALDTLVINNAYSEEIRAAHLSGGDAGIATLTIDQVSGDNYATENWSMSGDNLVHPSNSDQGAGVFRHKAVSGATTVYSPNRPWAYLPPPEVAIKWNPGHYVTLPQTSAHVPSHSVATQTTRIQEIAAMSPKPAGINLYIYWAEHETSKNVYKFDGTGGGSNIDAIFDVIKANGMRMMLTVSNYRGNNQIYENIPTYLPGEPNALGGAYLYGNSYTRVRLDASGTVDRWLAFLTAIGEHFDSDPKFEMVRLLYDSIARGTDAQGSLIPPNYTGDAAYEVQWRRIVAHGKVAFPTTNVAMALDWGFQDRTVFPGLVSHLIANRCAPSGPDVVGEATAITGGDIGINGQRAFIGLQWNGSAWVAGGVDGTGKVPCSYLMERNSMGAHFSATAQELHDTAVNRMKQTHMIWFYNTITWGATKTTLYWDNTKSYATTPRQAVDVKTWLTNTHSPTWTTKPTTYSTILTGG